VFDGPMNNVSAIGTFNAGPLPIHLKREFPGFNGPISESLNRNSSFSRFNYSIFNKQLKQTMGNKH
jgi:hypothetical protein